MEYVVADGGKQACITDEQARFFLENGFLVIRNVLQGEELRLVQEAMMKLLKDGAAEVKDDPDYLYGKGGKTGKDVLRRIEYVIDKSDPMKALLGHPFILRSVEKLQGRSFIPLKQQVLLNGLEYRAQAPYAQGERRYAYKPEGSFAVREARPIGTYRYPHEDYWRSGKVE